MRQPYHYPPMSVRKFVGRSLGNLRAPEFCEPLLRAVGSLLYVVRRDVSTKGFSSEGSINIDIRLMVRKLCAEPEDMKNEAQNS
jgi:hypothetical protein